MRKFMFGMLVGAGAALLYAPATGARTRSMIRDKATKLGNDATDFAEGKRRHVLNKMDGYKAKMRNMSENMRNVMGQGMDRDHAMSEPSI